ncbi:MAG: deoxyribodipyrimidine photo-lyase [Pseudomonadota bacterium]|nr:deoxyribodipyrimidine photo-lyase [Pseudomonadota bacterium]
MAKSIVLFHEDLRCIDHQPLAEAVNIGEIIPVYILDTKDPNQVGGAGKVWLHHALSDLNRQLDENMHFFKGDAESIIPEIMEQHDVQHLFCHERFDPYGISLHQILEKHLGKERFHSFNGKLLWHPNEIHKNDGTPYRVFTPFYRKGCLQFGPLPRLPLPLTKPTKYASISGSTSLEALSLLPNKPWGKEITQYWDISEAGAHKRLDTFIANKLTGYKIMRDFPGLGHTSKLSPFLRWGMISVNSIWDKLNSLEQIPPKDLDHFKSELGWREFSYYLLHHFPKMTTENLNPNFDHFPWHEDPALLKAWQQGQTGFPIIDAAMRQLYATGYMHNRLRMVVGSFLVKNLTLHWHNGQDWFWDCLFDADIANNSAGWQWIAGCGADAAPYFRIFNPILQAQKFDKDGIFIHQWVPELSKLPPPHCFQPWLAPPLVLQEADVRLGDNYPKPIIDLTASRDRALNAYAHLKAKKG